MHGVDHNLCRRLNVAHVLYQRHAAVAVEVEVGYHDVNMVAGAEVLSLFQAGGVGDVGVSKRCGEQGVYAFPHDGVVVNDKYCHWS